MKETKRERFGRIAEARVNRVLEDLRLLGNCSHRGNYEYTEEQVEFMFAKLRDELEATRRLFYTHTGSHKGMFSLSNSAGTTDEESDLRGSEIVPDTE